MALTSKQRRRMQLNMLMAAASFASTKTVATTTVTPLTIFGSRLMFWYDLSDVSSLYQSTDTSTPVTALNDPIGRFSDKSGKGNHATQSNASFKPLWKQDGNGKYNALFDATDDGLATAAIDFSASDKVSVFAAARKLGDAATGMLVEVSANTASNNGAWYLANLSAGGNWNWFVRGTGNADAKIAQAAPDTAVLSCTADLSLASGSELVMRRNGGGSPTYALDAGTGNFGNYIMYVGRRGGSTLPFNGQIYQLFGIQGIASAAEITAAETYMNSKSSAF